MVWMMHEADDDEEEDYYFCLCWCFFLACVSSLLVFVPGDLDGWMVGLTD